MAVTMDLLVAGLIAFVPNSSPTASTLTAYLVNAPQHVQTLEVYGNADIDLSGSGASCVRDSDKKIVCVLGNTDIEINDVNKSIFHQLPDKSASKERPKNINEEVDMDWLIRMSKIQTDEVIGRAKLWSVIKPEKTVGSQLTFGWDTAASSELDGKEAGKVALIGFRGSGSSALKQAVAESLTFRITVNQSPIKITLFNRDNGKVTNIKALCSKNNCLSVRLENNFSGKSCDDGDHFKHYYGLVRSAGKKLLPYSIDSRSCVKPGAKEVDRNLLRQGLRVFKPAAPKGVSAVLGEVSKITTVLTYEKLLKNVDVWVKDKVEKRTIKKFLLDVKKIQDRVICPPVLLEPA